MPRLVEQRVRRIKLPHWNFDDEEIGDTGVITRADDYVPGWDAGMFSVRLDKNGKSCNYWTRQEMLESWEVVDERDHPQPERDR